MISPSSGPTRARRCWIFFRSSNSLHDIALDMYYIVVTVLCSLNCIDFNITHLKVPSSAAHTPDLQPVIFCIKSESLFSFLKKVDLHFTQGILQLRNLPLALPYVPLQLILKGDQVKPAHTQVSLKCRMFSLCLTWSSVLPLCFSSSCSSSSCSSSNWAIFCR